MKRFFTLLTSLLLLSLIGNAQTSDRSKLITYTGKIVDAKTGEPLPYSQINHIYKLTGTDSLIIRNSVADKEGKFKIQSPRVMDNRIEIVCLGYKILTRMLSEAGNKERISYSSTISLNNKNNNQPEIYDQLDLGVLKLTPDVQQLDEVMVKARIKLFEQVGDTLLFFPKNIKQFEGETLEDILKRLPNFHVDDNGNIFVNGKMITRAKLNDKNIFGEDVRTMVTSIMAKEAGLIQVYDEVDEKSEILNGTEDATKRRVMNVITFKDFDMFKGVHINIETGLYADKDADGERQTMHNLNGKIGQYSANFRISLEGNTEKTAFPQEVQKSGIRFNTEVSADELERVFGIDYSFGKDKQEQESRTDQYYFPTSYFESQIVNTKSYSLQEKNIHNFGVHGQYIKKAAHSIQGSYSGTIADGDELSTYISNTIKDGQQLSYLQQLRRNDTQNHDHKANIDLTTRLKKIGAIQLFVRGSIVKNNENGIRTDSSYTGNMSNKEIFTISGERPNYRLASELFYRKKIGKTSISYTPSVNYLQTDQLYMAFDHMTNEIDSISSRDQIQKNLRISNAIGTSVKISPNFTTTIHIGYNAHKLQLEEGFAENTHTVKRFHTFTGQISLRIFRELYQFGVRDNSFMVNNLSTRLIDYNPMNLRVGNPNLKMGQTYFFNGGFRNNNLQFNVDYTYITDPVISTRRYFETDTPLDEFGGYVALAGATLNSYNNAKSHSDLSMSINSGTKRGAVMVRGNLGYRFSNPEVDLLGEIARSYTHSQRASLSLISNFSSTVRLDIKDYVSYNYTKIKSNEPQSHSWINNDLSANFNLSLFSRLMVDADYKYSYYYNSRTKQADNRHTLNASIDYRIFSNRKGLISLNAYNLLNTKSSLVTSTYDLYIQNAYRPENSTLFTISFQYKFGVEQ